MGLLNSLIHGASDALFIAEVDTGVIVFVNDAACRMMESTRDELIGLHQTQLHPAEDLEEIGKKFRSFVSSDEYKETEARILTKAGVVKTVLITSAERYEEDGKLFAAAFFKDISTSKKLNEVTVLQSHMVRKHLANILGITNILNDPSSSTLVDKDELILTLGQSATEMDEALRNVVKVAAV